MKSCARCTGQMMLDEDMHGKYWCCAQCGYNVTITTRTARPTTSITGREFPEIVFHLKSNKFMGGTTL